MYKSIISGAGKILSFKIIGTISNLLLNVWIARTLSIEILGFYNLMQSLLLFLAIPTRLGLDVYSIKVIPSLDLDMKLINSFIWRCFINLITFFILIALLFILVRPLVEQHLLDGISLNDYLIFFLSATLGYSVIFFMTSIYRSFGDVINYSVFQNFYTPFLTLLLVVAIHTLTGVVDPLKVYLLVLITGAPITFIYLFFFIRKKYKYRLKFERKLYRKPILKNSYPLIITSSAIFLMSYLGAFFISYFHGVREAGLYSGVVRLCVPIIFLGVAIKNYTAPKISKMYHNDNIKGVREVYKKSIQVLALLSVPIVLTYYIKPDFFLGFFGNEFIDYETPFLLYLSSVFISTVFLGPIGYLLAMSGNEKFYQKVIIISLVLNVILSVILIPDYSTTGAALATLVSTIFWKGASYSYLKKTGNL